MAEELQDKGAAASKESVETVGEMLRRTRLAKKQDLRDIASFLCIRYQFLEALEEGRYKELPGETYANGFVRSYASYLGLDAGEISERYKAEMSGVVGREPGLRSISEIENENAAPAPKVVLISAALLLIVFLVWRGVSGSPEEELPPAVESITVLDEVYPLPPLQETQGIEIIDEELHRAQPVSPTQPLPPVPPKKPAYNNQTGDVEAPVREKPPVAEVKAPVAEAETIRIYGQRNISPRIVLVANEDVWIEVTRDETILISRTLQKGDRYQVSRNSDDLYLRTGNAGGLDVYLDGYMMPQIGPRGATRSGIPLSPEYFMQEDLD